jgi:hypothetical protein
VAAEGEEVVGRADALDLEDLLPHPRKLSLQRGPRRDVLPAIRTGIRQRSDVDLATFGAGQAIENDDVSRNHVAGHLAFQPTSDLGGGERVRCRDVGGELNVAVLATRDHRRVGDPLLGQQRVLDLCRFDAESADLQLPVDPTQEFDRPVRTPSAEVAG